MRLIDVTNNPLENGIFSYLNIYNVPWKDTIDATALNFEYYYNVSGKKSVSNAVKNMLESAGALTDAQMQTLARTVYLLNNLRWGKLWDTLNFEYNPISNYDMTETETESGKTDSTATNGGSDVTSGTNESTTATTSTAENTVFAFNSTDYQNNDKDTTTGNGNTSTTYSETFQHGHTLTEEKTNSGNRTLTRSGNIGVTTSQQMIESERELWQWKYIYDIIYKDIDKMLTIQTYEQDAVLNDYTYNGGGSSGGDTSEILTKLNEIDAKIDNSTTSINLSIDNLRVSTFNAIDGVSNRNY